jgi:membrane-associated phospholipid phosphatase
MLLHCSALPVALLLVLGCSADRSGIGSPKQRREACFGQNVLAGTIASRSVDDIRFNKCPPMLYGNSTPYYAPHPDYVLGINTNVYPLLPQDYPIQGSKALVLQYQTMADSVLTENPMDFVLHGQTAAQYAAFVDPPHMPSSDPTSPYWDELREVVDAQWARRNNSDPADLSRWPNLWQDFNLTTIALAVWNEYPASLQQQLIVARFKTTPRLQMNRKIMPFRSMVDMVGTQLIIAALNTWSIEIVGPVNFLLKWTFGVPRPEEVAWLIASGSIGTDDGVPDDLVTSIRDMNLTVSTDFTAYPIGSPNHPSWPAMHAAGSTCSIWIPVVAVITPEEYCEALRIDYAVAYARTVAGVHYQMDNLAGLNLGQEILKANLPGYLALKYNSDPDLVAQRLEQLSFDWKDFDPYNCTIANQPVGDRLAY